MLETDDLTEFSEDEMSDMDEEENEESLVSDYEIDDDREIHKECIQKCNKKNYSNQWHSSEDSFDKFLHYDGQARLLENYDSEYNAFMAIMSPGIINTIALCTNIYIKRDIYKLKHKQLHVPPHMHETDAIEIEGLIGIWLKLGVSGFHNSSLHEIFSNTKSSSVDAHLCFSMHRYKYLMKSMRFDDKTKRQKKLDGTWFDKFCHVRQIFKHFTENCKEKYVPGKLITVDELLLRFRGRCSFRIYIPTKKAKFGLKIFCLVDPQTMYLVNSEVYLGRNEAAPEANYGMQVVARLTSDFMRAGRVIVTDNFFSSSELGHYLWNNQTCLLGTLRKNRVGNPADFVNEPIETGRAKFIFRGFETILAFQAQEKKRVLLYSTMHHGSQIHRSRKPVIIHQYNVSKFAIDIFDEMCVRYGYNPAVRRWPLRLYMHLCDAAAINARILFGGISSRRAFLIALSDQLVDKLKQRRAQTDHWMNEKWRQISSLYESLANHEPQEIQHCYKCNISGRGNHIRECNKCQRKICNQHTHEHSYLLCPECIDFDDNKPTTSNHMRTRSSHTSSTSGSCYRCTKTVKIHCTVCNNRMCSSHRSQQNPKHCMDHK